MNESTFQEMSSEILNQDDENFDNFATQFTHSLENLGEGDPPIYWHGRLIGYGAADMPYRLNLMGEPLDENEFRSRLKAKRIFVKEFELFDTVAYVPDKSAPSSALEPHIVEYMANLKADVDGKSILQKVKVTHRIRKTFIAYETEITLV